MKTKYLIVFFRQEFFVPRFLMFKAQHKKTLLDLNLVHFRLGYSRCTLAESRFLESEQTSWWKVKRVLSA